MALSTKALDLACPNAIKCSLFPSSRSERHLRGNSTTQHISAARVHSRASIYHASDRTPVRERLALPIIKSGSNVNSCLNLTATGGSLHGIWSFSSSTYLSSRRLETPSTFSKIRGVPLTCVAQNQADDTALTAGHTLPAIDEVDSAGRNGFKMSNDSRSSSRTAAKAATTEEGEGGHSRPPTMTPQEWARYDFAVPSTLQGAVRRFVREPSISVVCVCFAVGAAFRSKYTWGLADAAVAAGVAVWWAFQEWLVHRHLLHSDVDWFGRSVHARHHSVPFHHVSIDGINLIGPAMAASAALFHVLFYGNRGLALTATLAYFAMGLLYEWTHYLVHTKVPMRSGLARVIKRHHVKHHLRDARFWLSFTCPPIDNLFGTAPHAPSRDER
eukprot:jgi/Mesen1/6965/ME000360S06219